MEGCPSITVHHMHICSKFYKLSYHFKMAAVARSVEGCGTPRCLGVDGSPHREEELADVKVIGACCIMLGRENNQVNAFYTVYI